MGSQISVRQPHEIPVEQRQNVLYGEPTLEAIAALIQTGKVRNIVCMVGAGISCSAGIPDFRSPGTGLYDNLQKYDLPTAESIFTLDYFREHPEPFCQLAKELFPGKFKPTLTHFFIRLLQEKQLLLRCFSQNIDNLERLAGVRPDLLIESHGSFAGVHCIDCKAEWSLCDFKKQIMSDEIPRCSEMIPIKKPVAPPTLQEVQEWKTKDLPLAQEAVQAARAEFNFSSMLQTSLNVKQLTEKIAEAEAAITAYPQLVQQWEQGDKERVCRGLVKPDIVFFGEALPPAFRNGTGELEDWCDLALVMGTSLQVEPFGSMIGQVHHLCPRVLINREIVRPFTEQDQIGFRFAEQDNYRDVAVQSDCDAGVLRLAKMLGWEQELLALQSNYLPRGLSEVLESSVAVAAPKKSTNSSKSDTRIAAEKKVFSKQHKEAKTGAQSGQKMLVKKNIKPVSKLSKAAATQEPQKTKPTSKLSRAMPSEAKDGEGKLDPALSKRAAQLIESADALVFMTGAGMGVASGLGTFRGRNAAVWSPLVHQKELSFQDMFNPVWFEKTMDPSGKSQASANFGWAFWRFLSQAYTQSQPHDGYKILNRWALAAKEGAFNFTSNIDGHWLASGIKENRIYECHGNLRFMQCVRGASCETEVWPSGEYINKLKLDEESNCVRGDLPACRFCGKMARPNVLMFCDQTFVPARQARQKQHWLAWLKKLQRKNSKIVVLEIGAGTTVRLESEAITRRTGAVLIRINPEDSCVAAAGGVNRASHIEVPTWDSVAFLKDVDKHIHVPKKSMV